MSLFAKAKKAKENKKGFTLVELIVVLVILAILAAMLVPALLGWIDEARNRQYVLEARSVYMAAQAIADEKYAEATGNGTADPAAVISAGSFTETENKRIEALADVKNVTVQYVAPLAEGITTGNSLHDSFIINEMMVDFISANNTNVCAALKDGSWQVALEEHIDGCPGETGGGGVGSDGGE